jgi:hypothetical protein
MYIYLVFCFVYAVMMDYVLLSSADAIDIMVVIIVMMIIIPTAGVLCLNANKAPNRPIANNAI